MNVWQRVLPDHIIMEDRVESKDIFVEFLPWNAYCLNKPSPLEIEQVHWQPLMALAGLQVIIQRPDGPNEIRTIALTSS